MEYLDEAKKHLDFLDGSDYKRSLSQLADMVVLERTSSRVAFSMSQICAFQPLTLPDNNASASLLVED